MILVFYVLGVLSVDFRVSVIFHMMWYYYVNAFRVVFNIFYFALCGIFRVPMSGICGIIYDVFGIMWYFRVPV